MSEINDPLEKLLAAYLPPFEHERNGLDFYLKGDDLYIEVKQFYSARSSDQLARAQGDGKPIVLVQGHRAAVWLAELLRDAYAYRAEARMEAEKHEQ